jgi:hypothetical protein
VAGGREGPGGAYTKTMQSVPLPKKLQGAHQEYQTKSFDRREYMTIGAEVGMASDKHPSASQMGIHVGQVAKLRSRDPLPGHDYATMPQHRNYDEPKEQADRYMERKGDVR